MVILKIKTISKGMVFFGLKMVNGKIIYIVLYT